jgi:hypothetical protein
VAGPAPAQGGAQAPDVGGAADIDGDGAGGAGEQQGNLVDVRVS